MLRVSGRGFWRDQVQARGEATGIVAGRGGEGLCPVHQLLLRTLAVQPKGWKEGDRLNLKARMQSVGGGK